MNSGNFDDESDTSDEDYKPEGETGDLPSEVESDGDPEDDLPIGENLNKRSRSKTNKKPTKRRKNANVAVEVETETKDPIEEQCDEEKIEEERKKKADSLWADFMSDTDFKPKPKTPAAPVRSEPLKKVEKVVQKTIEPCKKVKVTQIFEFAGEEVKVTKEVAADSAEARLLPKPSSSGPQSSSKPGIPRGRAGLGGISSVLSQLGKKQKISVLEKTKLDWDSFKKEEDIDEELQRHNKGKDG